MSEGSVVTRLAGAVASLPAAAAAPPASPQAVQKRAAQGAGAVGLIALVAEWAINGRDPQTLITNIIGSAWFWPLVAFLVTRAWFVKWMKVQWKDKSLRPAWVVATAGVLTMTYHLIPGPAGDDGDERSQS